MKEVKQKKTVFSFYFFLNLEIESKNKYNN